MEENPINSLPTQAGQQQPAFLEKHWLVGLILVGLLLALPSIFVLAQTTTHPKDDWIVTNATRAITIGVVTIAVASVLTFVRSIPTIIRTARSWFNARHCWYRFSLRTMLVLMTLVCILCCYLGWAMNWKLQRQAFLSKPGIKSVMPTSAWLAPLLLWPVGEKGYYIIVVSSRDKEVSSDNEDDAKEARRLFPESKIQIYSLGRIFQFRRTAQD
jgi:hypothetical protein